MKDKNALASEHYLHSTDAQQKLYKRTLFIVLMSQIFGGAGFAAGITVGALLAKDMLGTESIAGLPSALFTLGSALAAFIVGQLSQSFGRRYGLSFGLIAGGIGAIGVIIAANLNSIVLLFLALFVYGAGTSTNLQARYAGTDLANDKQRATATSIAMVAATFGAVLGPNLIEIMGRFAASIGVPALGGPLILSAAAFILAGLALFVMLRPDPLEIAKMIEAHRRENEYENKTESLNKKAINKRGFTVDATVMVLTQIVMVAIMTMTPVHMKHHGHGLSEVGIVKDFM